MDFMHDAFATGETLRVFTLIDVFTRECLALEVGRGFTGHAIAQLLTEAGERRGTQPAIIQYDNGTELTSVALDHWPTGSRASRL